MAHDGPDTWIVDMFAEADEYKRWMLKKMRASRYGMLFDILYNTEFTWTLSWDEHRASDGKDLRLRFEEERGVPCSETWLEWPCSFLEMLIALAYSIEDRIMYDATLGDRTYEWFWLIMENLKLEVCTDEWIVHSGRSAMEYIDGIVKSVLERTYDFDGYGGMFPLHDPAEDQRDVELWYQANAYFMEKMEI